MHVGINRRACLQLCMMTEIAVFFPAKDMDAYSVHNMMELFFFLRRHSRRACTSGAWSPPAR